MKPLFSKTCLVLCLLSLAVGASAQQKLTFSDLPLIDSPSPIPTGYGQLTWGNFFYVNPYGWSGAGNGFKLGPQGEDVAFIGGEFCRLSGNVCYGTLSDARGFMPVSANVAGGYGPVSVTITAYNNGSFIGTVNYSLTDEITTLNFPASWGVVTELSIQASGQSGNFVLYELSLYTLGG
jgi:hypothetical protein